MAERRMFAKKITESDAFCAMPSSTQCYYFHLCQNADDEGFVNSPIKVLDYTHSSRDDFNLLVAKHFIIPFDSGVVVIKGWYIHNLLRKDRMTETEYKDEKSMLVLDGDNYRLRGSVNQETTNCQPSDNQLTPQYRIGQDSINLFVNDIKEKINNACAYAKDIFAFEIDLIINALSYGCTAQAETYAGETYTAEKWQKVVETADEQLISEVVNALHVNHPDTDGIRYTLGIFANKLKRFRSEGRGLGKR